MAKKEKESGRMTTVKPLGARYMYESYELLSVSMFKEYVHSKPVGSCWCQTCSNSELSYGMAHITRSLHVWKTTFLFQTHFPSQGSNEMYFSRCIILHMVMRDSDKNTTCSSSGENAISMSLSSHSISVRTMTSVRGLPWEHLDYLVGFASASVPIDPRKSTVYCSLPSSSGLHHSTT